MNGSKLNLMLADDDTDDCIFFKEVLDEFPVSSSVTMVNDGIELMNRLTQNESELPDVLFLDLNMPRKTGYECLSEIKLHKKLKSLPVIIFSTSFDHEVINLLYEKKAHYYIRKPGEFSKLKEIVHKALSLTINSGGKQPDKENFLLYSG